MYFAPIHLMTEHKETSAALWRQMLGGSYVWWALALIVVAGAVALRDDHDDLGRIDSAPAHAAT
jgi:alpha-1,2-mannosyltransferase